ncbi:HWE histidine kinase domain-containing protein [Rhodoplanes sp. TEM]|uniref:Blue-light-activated histidine kinase n=1 Tax=Rhodoplanes tepidamans TaxID=200616 RepID=A0ABT5JBX3_RHOTP|nr:MULTISPECIES: HWE histidine kinase domain-containing protein [Rhodoplanes]MDC7786948.1 HWE histidine kinase domain-containing protein [Rhodoplanes tepidamans]MDC7985061.1 HWE histidine kinase domain-containing protein [Rhodoplanes sp. TEM]MDQ0355355.1 two-component sensor histidine kinase [Rhodoplanes tepidamans]
MDAALTSAAAGGGTTCIASGKLNSWKEMLDALPVAAYLCDVAGVIVHCNRRAAEMWGRSPRVADDAPAVWPPRPVRDTDPARHHLGLVDTPVGQFMRTGQPVRDREIVLERSDGGRAIVLANIEPITGDDGAVLGAVGCFQDITERKRADHQQRTLLNELNHRVKNTLATVQSFADHTIRKCGLSRQVQEDFEGRLVALSRAHDQLTRGRWEPIDLATIIESAVEPSCGGRPDRLRVGGDTIRLGAQASLTLSLVFHELAANAAKYGALSVPAGQVAVTWTVEDRGEVPTVRVVWEEQGGPPVTAPEHAGFGCRLVRHGLARQLHGTAVLDWASAGLRCTMDIPLSSTPG